MHPMIGEPDTPPITSDPPVQQFYRELLTPFFTPTAADALEPATREHAHAIIDRFIADGHADLSGQFAEVLIPLVFYTDIVHVPPHLIEEFMRRTVVPGDVIDRLISSGLSGVPFTNEDVTKVATILLIGRTDTIRTSPTRCGSWRITLTFGSTWSTTPGSPGHVPGPCHVQPASVAEPRLAFGVGVHRCLGQDSSARVSGCSMSSLSATITLSLL
jgi:hypothetical protein